MSIRKLLSNIYQKNKKYKIIKATRAFIYNTNKKIEALRSKYNFYRESKIKRLPNSPIIVVFITQFIPAWSKVKQIYEIMKSDKLFKPIILCVPNDLECQYDNNDTYEWFAEHGYECINAKNNDNTWFNLRKLAPEYVFHCRPYNHFMPKPYRSTVISSYAKICNILYSTNIIDADNNVLINWDFFKNCYCFYGLSVDEVNQFNKSIKYIEQQRSIFLGSPGLSDVMQFDYHNQIGSWKTKHNQFRIIWTPRWSTDPIMGGSNFFNYYKKFFTLSKELSTIEMMIRPHPLTFSNFIKTGEMTEKEVKDYKQLCNEQVNVILDEDKEYIGSFWNSDVLVSDISGVLFDYFVTGKPIIFCSPNNLASQHFFNTFNKMMNGFYIANNFDEIENILKKLMQGNDPLKEERKKIIEEIWGNNLYNCPKAIVEDLLNDRNKKFL